MNPPDEFQINFSIVSVGLPKQRFRPPAAPFAQRYIAHGSVMLRPQTAHEAIMAGLTAAVSAAINIAPVLFG